MIEVKGIIKTFKTAAKNDAVSAAGGAGSASSSAKFAWGKSKKSIKALDNVYFTVKPNRITGILGQNGAGKSTMLRVLAGTILPDAGQILFDGEILEPKSRRARTALLFGGKTGLYDELSALDNILYFAKLRGVQAEKARQDALALGEQFEMNDLLHKKVSALSTGMKQKVAIVRALIHDPDIIMLDEPESGLDFAASALLNDFLIDYAKSGKTVLVSSHSAGDILDLCEDVVVLKAGVVTAEQSLRELVDGKSLEESFRLLKELVIGK